MAVTVYRSRAVGEPKRLIPVVMACTVLNQDELPMRQR